MDLSSNVNNSTNQKRPPSNQNIQAYVRVRPLNSRERCIRSTEVVEVVSPREVVARHSLDSKLTKKFTFDRAFGQESKQCDIYHTVVAPLIDEVLAGYNCTVFAYGQTGTGKTHTMVGTEVAELKSSWEDDSEIGIIPRALSHLFDELRMMELEFSMRISYLELYNEELCDLLSSDDSVKIRIFDDSTKKGSVIIQGLEEIPVHSKDDVYKLLEKGKERRKTATTLMNAQSSRSHTVFSILVHIRENGIDGEEMLKIGKLNLVDLAGSENVSKAGNEKGIRVRETVNINQSLLTLGRVITALVERTPHVPYRESKLTRLLQESLGGRTKTSIIATISPGHKDIEETLSTLEYAHRAKNIQNKPEVNQKLTKKVVLKEYTEEIDKLKRDLMAARDKNGIYLAEETYNEMTNKMDSQNRELNEKMLLLKALKDELQSKEKIFNEVSLNLVEKTEELKKTERNLSHTQGALMTTKKVLTNTKRRYKEKKVLLESHVKTEEELTNQASKILEVADVATQDTQQLHNTIERRRDVDQKIHTACERFSDRMIDNFELMDENLNSLRNQHTNFIQLLTEDLSNSMNVQNKLLIDANQKIKETSELSEKSLSATNAFFKKLMKTIGENYTGHKSSLESMFKELIEKEQELKTQISSNLNDLATFNEEQTTRLNTMLDMTTESLNKNTENVKSHTAQMQKYIADTISMSESSIKILAHVQQETSNERDLADQEQTILDEFLKKMQHIKTKREACTDKISSLVVNLGEKSESTIASLKQCAEYEQDYCENSCAASSTLQANIAKQSSDALLLVDRNLAKSSTIQMQISNLCQETSQRVDTFANAEELHSNEIKKILADHSTEATEIFAHSRSSFDESSTTLRTIIADYVGKLKSHVSTDNEFTASLNTNLREYAQIYEQQMGQCVQDLNNFKRNELQTYTATGSTPSKRDFIYPRVLAQTSPHQQIVKRLRQENDWSDLDTTATIDEGSEEDVEESQERTDISDTETILNSTPLEDNEIRKASSFDRSNSNFLKPPLMLSVNSSYKASPRKYVLRPSSPKLLKENKENIS